MDESPGLHKRSLFRWKRTSNDVPVKVNLCLAVTIPGMEMGRVMLACFFQYMEIIIP